METISEFLSDSQAREKLMRTVQYACTLASHVNERTWRRPEASDKLKALVSHLKLSRKLLRLGRSVNSLHALRLSARLSNPVLRLCLSSVHATRALYFVCDNLLWAWKVRLAPHLDSQRWGAQAARCYLLSLIACLLRDLYEIITVIIDNNDETAGRNLQTPAAQQPETTDVWGRVEGLPQTKTTMTRKGIGLWGELRRRPELWVDLAKNALDLPSPLDRLGVFRVDEGIIGLCGLASSILGLVQLMQPGLKLRP
ncbi:peroxisomal membrane protein 11B-like [Lampetra fluviatilis]